MRSRSIVAALFLSLCAGGSASAQVLALEFHDGHVKLTAENVPVSRILAEWARVGGTRIVNGERVPGAPVSLQIDAPERQALEIILRGAAGYMVLARDTIAPGASAFDKVMVLPTTTRAPAAPAQPQPVAQPQQFPNRPEPDTFELEEQDENPPAPPPGFPRGRVPVPGVNLPSGVPPPQPDPDEDEPDPNTVPPAAPGNPFGVVPGGARPGTINAPPRTPNEVEQVPR